MRLRSLAVNQFKKFTKPTRLDGIGDGLNLVVGPNEIGKSTLLDALRAVLFEKYNSRAQPIVVLQNDRNQAAPVVELAFELDDGLYCITKRFIKKPYARLSCPDGRLVEGDTAEDTLRHLLGFDEPGNRGAKPETLGMWNVLWVQQGGSFGAPDLPESARSSLHNALESEVGKVLGGRRGRALPQSVETQLSELITPATKKPRGQYKELIDRVGELGRELEDLRANRKNLAQTLNDLEENQEALARLSSGERDQADQKELEETRRRHGELAKLQAGIEAASSGLELKRRNLEQARQAATDRQQLRDDIEAEEASVANTGNRLTEVRKEERKVQSRLQKLWEEVRETETDVAKADDAVSRQHRVVSAVKRRAGMGELEGRRQRAAAAEERQRANHLAAAAIPVTEEALDAIRKAAGKLERIQNRLSAAATLITFDMTPQGSSGIEVNDEPLSPDRPTLQAVEPANITIPERGRITIEPAITDRDKLLRQQRAAKNRLRAALEQAGTRTAAEAEDQHAKRQKLLQEAELARQEAALQAPATDEREAGARALSDHIQGLRQILTREMEDLQVEELPALGEAEAALNRAQDQAEQTRSLLGARRAALSGPQEARDAFLTQLGKIQGRYEESHDRLDRLKTQLAQAVKDRSDEDLQARIEAGVAAHAKQEEVIARLEAQRTGEGLPLLEARIKRLENALLKRHQKRTDLEVKIAGLKSRVEAAEGAGLDEAIEHKIRELELGEQERSRKDREVQVLGLLVSTLRRAEQQAKERYLSPVLNRLRPYLQFLFPGADIRIDENLHVTGVVREAGHEEAFHHLSMGTQEQIAVLVRLAFAEMLVEQGHPATVVLDDALVFSDDRRIGRMFDILNRVARKVQIIVLTCREQLFEGLGGHPLSLAPGNSEELMSA